MKKIIFMAVFTVLMLGVILFPICITADDVFECEEFKYIINSDNTVTIVDYDGSDETINIPSMLDGKKVSTIQYNAFTNNEYIVNVIIADSISQVGWRAFYGCSKLQSVTFMSVDASLGADVFPQNEDLVIYGYAESTLQRNAKKYNLKFVEVETPLEKLYDYEQDANGELVITKYKGYGQNIIVPNEILGKKVVKIGDNAFEFNDVETVEISKGITVIGNAVFKGCTSLQKISIPDGVIWLKDQLFVNCYSLTDISIPSSVQKMGSNVFYKCSSLERVTIPSGVKSLGDSLFWECKSLKSITIPDSVTSIGTGIFYGCESLINVYLSKNITSIPVYAFYNCSNLTEIEIPNSIKEISSNAFYNCSGLSDIILPQGVTSIYEEAFAGCSGLRTIKILSNVSYIGEDVFMEDNNLTIYGYEGSKIYEYAKEYDIPFLNIIDMDADTSKYYNVTTNGGTWDGTYYYLPSGQMVRNSFFSEGTYTYYLQADGTPMKDRLTYHPDGVHVIYFDADGHEVFSDFAHISKSIAGADVDDMCFFNVYGYMYVDTLTYDKTGTKLYYVNPYGVLERNGWFQFSGHEFDAGLGFSGKAGGYGYANWDCSLMVDTYTYDWNGNFVYMQGDGHMAQ